MVRKVFVLALVAMFTGIAPVAAGQGTWHTTDLAQFGPPLPDAALEGVRGGFNGLAFSVFLTTFITSSADLTGSLGVNFGTSSAPSSSSGGAGSDFSAQNTAVRTAAVLGNFQGASGIFQLALVPGNNNVVLNTLNIQIVIVNVPNGAAIPSFSNLFR